MTMPGFGVKSVAAIARASGAPLVPTAGVDLLARPGQALDAGAPLLRIHAATSFALESAVTRAQEALANGGLFRTRAGIPERA